MRYINVIGTSGSGKSTLARQLAVRLNLPYIEMDNLFWKNDWQQSTDEEFFAKLRHAMDKAEQGWVIDGNYTRTMPLKLEKIDTIIWLDYSFSINFYQLSKRTFTRILSRKQLWTDSNNHENWKIMLSKESIFIWMINTYSKNRQQYLAMMQDPKYQHIQFIHLTSPKQTKAFLRQL
ncbi:MAG: AAA family ATPase [Acinetobacter populi]|jgi:adenylate kinase family enzyme|uniref:AAA family ATPase n=1 Tax=Acinetobacter populi TaxID=1582270 RepID=UPI002354C692|nr:AAA family ATPase [Acinetobacter populi]MCH4246312.1 AAA family ATPase [Acinetobacter populi]